MKKLIEKILLVILGLFIIYLLFAIAIGFNNANEFIKSIIDGFVKGIKNAS